MNELDDKTHDAHMRLQNIRHAIETETAALLAAHEVGDVILIGGQSRVAALRALLAASKNALHEFTQSLSEAT